MRRLLSIGVLCMNASPAWSEALQDPIFHYMHFNQRSWLHCPILNDVIQSKSHLLDDGKSEGFLNFPGIYPGLHKLPNSILASIILEHGPRTQCKLLDCWQQHMSPSTKQNWIEAIGVSNHMDNSRLSIKFKYVGTGQQKYVLGLSEVYISGMLATRENTHMIPEDMFCKIYSPYEALKTPEGCQTLFEAAKTQGRLQDDSWLGDVEGFAILDPEGLSFEQSNYLYKIGNPISGNVCPPVSVADKCSYSYAYDDRSAYWADLFCNLHKHGVTDCHRPYASYKFRQSPHAHKHAFCDDWCDSYDLEMQLCESEDEEVAADFDKCKLLDDCVCFTMHGVKYMNLFGKKVRLNKNSHGRYVCNVLGINKMDGARIDTQLKKCTYYCGDNLLNDDHMSNDYCSMPDDDFDTSSSVSSQATDAQSIDSHSDQESSNKGHRKRDKYNESKYKW